jgi:hypothetical protein
MTRRRPGSRVGWAAPARARVSKERTMRALPARIASSSPWATWTEGWPRRIGGVVEAGQVVVDERGAVQQLDGDGGGLGECGMRVAAGLATARHSSGLKRAPPGNTA